MKKSLTQLLFLNQLGSISKVQGFIHTPQPRNRQITFRAPRNLKPFILQKDQTLPEENNPRIAWENFGSRNSEEGISNPDALNLDKNQTEVFAQDKINPFNLPLASASSLLINQGILAIQTGNIPLMETLIDSGFDVNKGIDNQLCPLSLAIRSGSQEMVSLLLKNGADPNARDIYNPSPEFAREYLTSVIFGNNKQALNETAQFYLKHRDQDIFENRHWNQPLISTAALMKSENIVKELLSYGAKVDKDFDDMFYTDSMDISIANSDANTTLTLLDFGALATNTNKLLIPISQHSNVVVEALLRHGASPVVYDASSNTPLKQALKSNNFEAVNMLLGAHHSYATHYKEELKKIKGKSATDSREKSYKSLLESNSNIIADAIIYSYSASLPDDVTTVLIKNKEIMESDIPIDDLYDKVQIPNTNTHTYVLSQKKIMNVMQDMNINFEDEILKCMRKSMHLGSRHKMYLESNFVKTSLKTRLLDPNKKHSIPEIFKVHTRFIGTEKDKAKINKVYDNLVKYQDPYIDLILTLNALNTLKPKPFTLFASGEKYPSLAPFMKENSGLGTTLGLCNSMAGEIFFSKIGSKTAERILLHEMTHNTMWNVRNQLEIPKIKEIRQDLDHSIENIRKNIIVKEVVDANQVFDQIKPSLDMEEREKLAATLEALSNTFGSDMEGLTKLTERISKVLRNEQYSLDTNQVYKEIYTGLKFFEENSPSGKEDYLARIYLKSSIGRVLSMAQEYSNKAYINEDVLCDIMASRELTSTHDKIGAGLTKLTRSVLDFFDQDIEPIALKIIIQDPDINRMILPTSIKKRLMEKYPEESLEKGITLSKMELNLLKRQASRKNIEPDRK